MGNPTDIIEIPPNASGGAKGIGESPGANGRNSCVTLGDPSAPAAPPKWVAGMAGVAADPGRMVVELWPEVRQKGGRRRVIGNVHGMPTARAHPQSLASVASRE